MRNKQNHKLRFDNPWTEPRRSEKLTVTWKLIKIECLEWPLKLQITSNWPYKSDSYQNNSYTHEMNDYQHNRQNMGLINPCSSQFTHYIRISRRWKEEDLIFLHPQCFSTIMPESRYNICLSENPHTSNTLCRLYEDLGLSI